MSNCKGSAGGQVMAVVQRKRAIDKYNICPKICLNCNKTIDIRKGQKVGEVRKKKFCDRSCAAVYNNRRKGLVPLNRNSSGKCKICSCDIIFKRAKSGGYQKRSYCSKCLTEFRAKRNGADTYIANLTRDQLMSRYAKYYIGRNMIRQHAKKIFNDSKKDKKCIVCGYDKHIDVAHVKGVSDFDGSVLISIINNQDNLVALCPNHHWEYDEGLIAIEPFLK